MVCCKQVPSLGAGRMAAPWRHGAACGALRKIRAVLNGLELERTRQALCTATRVASAPHSSCRTVVASVAAGVDRPMGRSTPTRGIVRTSVAATAAAAAGSRTAAAVVLGIESSCDDTGVAVVTSDGRVLGEAIATQADIHAQWGGVVPNLARDAHAAAIDRTVDSALAAAGLTPGQLTAIAVTIGPGLGLCLRVGAAKARDMARQYGIPLISVHHMEAHALVARLPATAAATAPPAVRLTATLSPTETAPVAAGGPPAPHQLILRPDVTDTQPHVPEPQLPEYNGNRTEHEAGNHVHREEASPQEVHQHSHREMRSENARFVNGRRNGDGQSGSASACRPEQHAALTTAERAAAATVTAAGSAAAAAATTGGPAVATSAAVGGAAAETGAVTQAAAASRGAARGEIVDPAAVLEQIEGIGAVPFPFLCLLVSGGHNLLVLVRGVGSYMQLGSTVDDALGEAYDKVARLLNLELRPHGGAALEALAREGDPRAFKFKVPMRQHATCDFSFAGLKTSTRLAIEQNIPVARPQDPVATQAARDASTPAAVQTPPPAPPPCSASTSSMAADNDRSPMALANQIDSTASSTASSSLVTSSALTPSSTTTTGHSTARLSSSSSAAVATPGILLEPSAEPSSPSLSSASLSLSAAAVTTSEGDSAQVSMPMSATELRRVKANIAASFQSVAVTHLMEKTRRAVVWAREVVPELRHLVVAGGVASNKVVRESLKQLAETDGLELVVPPARWCTDNGVMVAWTGLERLARGWAEPPPPPQPPCTSITSPTQGSYPQGLPRTASGTAGTQAVVTETPKSASSGQGEEGVGASGGSGGGWSSKEGQGQVEADWIELKPRWPLTGEMHPRAAAARKEERRSLKRVRMHIPLSELTPPPTPSVASPAVTEARGLGGGSSGDGSSVASCSEVGVLASALV